MDDLDAEFAAFQKELESLPVVKDEEIKEPPKKKQKPISISISSKPKLGAAAKTVARNPEVIPQTSSISGVSATILSQAPAGIAALARNDPYSNAAMLAMSGIVNNRNGNAMMSKPPPPAPSHLPSGVVTDAHIMQQQSAYSYDPNRMSSSRIPAGSTLNNNATATTNTDGASDTQTNAKKRKVTTRYAAGRVWEDKTLDEWPENDYRMFVGDLGIEASDDMLSHLFRKYTSFQKAKVIKDKRTEKNKGYGFVSFSDPFDCMKALREMNGKFCGNRPMKLKKSEWGKKNIKVASKRLKGDAKRFAKASKGRK